MTAPPKVHYDRGGDRPRCGTGYLTTTSLARVTCKRCILRTLAGAA